MNLVELFIDVNAPIAYAIVDAAFAACIERNFHEVVGSQNLSVDLSVDKYVCVSVAITPLITTNIIVFV
jgi:hypothetical protein